MNYNYIPKIKTKRLLLQELKQSDWGVISFLRTDKNVNKFVKRPSAKSKEEALAFISKIKSDIKKQNLFFWSVSEKSNSEMIGSVCLWNFLEDKKSAEIGYELSPNFQQKGIMNEALKSVLEFGFNKLNLAFIEAYTYKENIGSIKLLEKNKFKRIKERVNEHNVHNIIYKIEKANS